MIEAFAPEIITAITVVGIAAIFALLQHLRATAPTKRRSLL
ncbi:hypothetical protein [Ensifer sp. ENS04]|nr:hypothetical protein [Ensifer sp. ENS04]